MAVSTAYAGARFIDPAVLARVGRLELIARTVVEGFLSGLHRSPHLGASMDFAEHRAYSPGDDIRRIDWRLFARTDRHFVKEFEADTNTDFTCILDVSKSMDFSGAKGRPTKLEYAKYLAACLTYFSSRQRDRVGLITFDSDVVDRVPPSAKHLQTVLHTLDRLKPGGQGDLAAPLRKITEFFRRRCIVALISDLYHDPQDVMRAVVSLRGKGNDVIVIHLLDPAEVDFPYDDATNFEDLESGTLLPVIPALLREQYKDMVAKHLVDLNKVLGEAGVDYARFDTSKPLDFALYDYLSRRERMRRVR
jgi:uncharacterized protein (DUF58 family)